MLRVGLTGGIGSGKSTVAARLVERGAVLVDSDRIAREVVAAATPGLAAVVGAFGTEVLAADGNLNRPALAAVVFDDPAAREKLNAIVHPLVRRRSNALIAAARAESIVVQDIPLLVEGGMAVRFPLVVVVHADTAARVRRLVEQRGMPEADARSRIAAQADEAARRAVADVWLDNSGPPHRLAAAVDALWDRRLVPFAANLDACRAAAGSGVLVGADPEWPAEAGRLAARIASAAGERGRGVAHVGATAVPGLPAPDVIDLQLGVESSDDVDAVGTPLADAGFVRADAGYASADPGRPARLHVRVIGSPEWRDALRMRDWLRTDAAARAEYAAAARRAAVTHGAEPAVAPAARFAAAAEAWAASSGWAPSLNGTNPDG
ncbi:MAG: dephospho-CoA kinase [Pseudonocardia sp.]|nr:dephospho-CoA kinase [Pseudonocardia sp.]